MKVKIVLLGHIKESKAKTRWVDSCQKKKKVGGFENERTKEKNLTAAILFGKRTKKLVVTLKIIDARKRWKKTMSLRSGRLVTAITSGGNGDNTKVQCQRFNRLRYHSN